MKTKINKIYKISTIFLATTIILVLFCVWMFFQIKKSSDDLIASKNELAAMALQSIETEKFRQNYNFYKLDFQKIDQLFVDPADPVNFIKFLEDTAQKNEIISQISLPSSKQANQDSMIFQIVLKGNFSAMQKFLKEIESGAYLLQVENLAIQISDEKGDQATISIKVLIK